MGAWAANSACAAIASIAGCVIASAMVAASSSGAAIVIGVTGMGGIVIGPIVNTGACRCLRAGCGDGGGATESCVSVVTASKRDRNDIRVLLLCAPVLARRESPSATWATRWIGSCLA